MFITLKMALIVGVGIVAVGGIVTGIVFATMGDSCEVFNAPSDLYFEQKDSKLVVKWGSPHNATEDCAIKYKLLVTIDGKETAIETEEEEYEIKEEIAPCTSIKATLTAINDSEEESDGITKEYKMGVGDVSQVAVKGLNKIQSGNDWTLKWEKPDGYQECTFTYKITMGESTIIEDHDTETIVILNDILDKCKDNIITVQPKIEESDGKADPITVFGGVGDVSQVAVKGLDKTSSQNGWTLKWEKPDRYEECAFTYKIVVGESTIINEVHDTETIEISNDKLDKCEDNVVTVQPKIEGSDGKAATIAVRGGVGDVSQVTVKGLDKIQSGNDWTLKWEKPDGYENCIFTYKITKGDSTIIKEDHDIETIDISNDKLDKCKDNVITVQPKIEESDGKADTITVVGGVGDVSEVTVKGLNKIQSGNDWTLKWEKPDGYEECTFTYKIVVGGSTIINEAHTTETIDISNDKLDKCDDNVVTVQPKIEGSDGKAATITVRGGVGDVSQVTVKGLDKIQSGNDWTLKWEKPDGYENCIFTYKITKGESTIIKEDHDTETIVISNDKLDQCKDNVITVQPKIEESDGKADTITIAGGVGDVSEVTVKGLDKIQSGNDWTLKWEKPDGYEECTFTYKIVVGGSTIINEAHTTETIDISNDKLDKCDDNVVTVQPKIEGSDGKATTITVRGGVGDVSQVTVKGLDKIQSGNDWTLKWEKPDGYENCIFTYKITKGESTIIKEDHDTETIDISNDKLDKCKDNVITVQPKIEESDGKADTITVAGGVGDVSEVTVKGLDKIQSGNDWTLKWEKPDGYEECTFTYKIVVGGSTIINEAHTTETIDISNDKLDKCDDNVVTVQPKIEGSDGEAATITVRGGVGDVSQVTVKGLDKIQSGNDWTLKWEKPDGYENCVFTYKITKGDSTIIKEEHDTETIDISNDKLDKCKDNVITVQPKIEESDGKADTITVAGGVGDVSEVTVKGLDKIQSGNDWTLKWEKPDGYEECTFTYKIVVGESTIIEEAHATETIDISNDKLDKCDDNVVTVQPKIEGSNGKADTITVRGGVGDVSDVTVKGLDKIQSGNDWTLKWEKPDGYENCIFTYKITKGDSTIIKEDHDTETIDISNDKLDKCKDNVITVQPKIEESDGKADTITVAGGVGDVSEVTVKGLDKIQSGNDWTLKWEKPDGYEECTFTYKIVVGESTIINEAHTTETIDISNDKLDKCDDNVVTVQPKIEGSDGKADTITVHGGVGDVSQVTVKGLDKIQSGNDWTLKWEKPDGYENCIFTYKITKGDSTIIKEDHDTETIDISNDKLDKCKDNVITVQPKIEESDGKADTVTVAGGVGDVSEVTVKGLDKIQSGNDWTLKWEKPDGYEECTFTYKIVVGESTIINEAHDTETIDISNDKLDKCKDYIVTVQPKIEGSDGKAATITVRGGVGDVSQVTVKGLDKIQSGNDWTLKWEKPDGYENCIFTYKITKGDSTIIKEEHDTETIDISNDKLDKCKDNVITVQPKIEESDGKADTITVAGGVGDVSEVTVKGLDKIQSGNDWTLEWEKPDGYEECTFTYKIVVGESTIISEAHATETIDISNDKLDKCKDNIVTVQPKIEGSDGKAAAITITLDHGDVSGVKVENLKTEKEDDRWTVKWDKPSGYESCTITYEQIINADPPDTIEDVSTFIPNGDLKPCEENSIKITPIFGEDRGLSDEISIIGNPVSIGEVQNGKIEVTAETNLVKVSWDKPAGLDKCNFSYNLVLKKNDEQVDKDDALPDSSWEKTVGNIVSCENLAAQVTAVYLVNGNNGAPTDITGCSTIQ